MKFSLKTGSTQARNSRGSSLPSSEHQPEGANESSFAFPPQPGLSCHLEHHLVAVREGHGQYLS